MANSITEVLKQHAFNIPGWRSKRKMVVFESDDWGGVRMPNRNSYQKLLDKGIKVDAFHYDYLDCLESKEDLNNLFEVLSRFKDSNGNYPVFTFNTVMANPDFDKIKANHFQEYFFEDFQVSYQKYWGVDLLPIWQKAIQEKLIVPQFHAREHLNVSLWMKALQGNYKEVLTSFEHGYTGMWGKTPSQSHSHYLAAFHPTDANDSVHKQEILINGLKMFENKFGYKSETIISCNYVWNTGIEKAAKNMNVKFIQGQRAQLKPDEKNGKLIPVFHYTGQKNNFGQIYSVRNCMFEPSENINHDWVNNCLKQIAISFLWNKPAIISTHRVNYIGSLNQKNRDNNLKLLEQLLHAIKIKWPNVEFVSSNKIF